MSRYNTIIKNDVANGEGVCVSFFVQGCPHHCPECFNPETWDFNEGKEYTDKVKWEIIKAISANGIQRNFSVLGGEPLAPQNLEMTLEVIDAVRHAYPDIKITLWTGYTYEELTKKNNTCGPSAFAKITTILAILDKIDVLIDGPFIKEEKDLSLKLRGSRNQHIRKKINSQWEIQYD